MRVAGTTSFYGGVGHSGNRLVAGAAQNRRSAVALHGGAERRNQESLARLDRYCARTARSLAGM
jgi:hypothetical protein